MAVASKIKALIKLKGRENAQLAKYLGISAQALSNKLYRDSFSAADLIKVAAFLDCDLAFVVDEAQRIILNESDLKSIAGEEAKS